MKNITVRRYATQATVHEMLLAHSGDLTATGARTFNVVTLEQTDWVVVPDDDPRVDTIEDFRVPTCSQQVNHPNGFVVGCELPIGHLGKHAALIHDVDEYRWAGGPMESPTPSPRHRPRIVQWQDEYRAIDDHGDIWRITLHDGFVVSCVARARWDFERQEWQAFDAETDEACKRADYFDQRVNAHAALVEAAREAANVLRVIRYEFASDHQIGLDAANRITDLLIDLALAEPQK